MTVDSPNVGVAFALVVAAGTATALGASVVFFPRLVKLASRRVLASALGFSAGVMSYVSFVEIFNKSRNAFEASEETPERSYVYATLCFFGGAVVMLLVDVVVRILSGNDGEFGHGHSHDHHHDFTPAERVNEDNEGDDVKFAKPAVQCPHCMACSPDPVRELELLQHQADEIISNMDHGHDHGHDSPQAENTGSDGAADLEVDDTRQEDEASKEREQKKLIKMGIKTAIAIGIHNFPEGLATFVAALNDARVGAVLAVAIGIHNIPEGLCVALPIYYATGNRMKAFCWALLSGASEPVAALLGWAVLANSFSDTMYGILFGLVAGMMVIISIRELLPTAHRYDPDDTVVTFSFIGGMVVMALSLVLFVL